MHSGADDETLRLITTACGCADHILGRYLGVPVAKARHIDTPEDFDRAVAVLAAELRSRTAENEQRAVAAAVRVLDVDWSTTSPEQRRELVARAVVASRKTLALNADKIRPVFKDAATKVAQAGRLGAIAQSALRVSSQLSALDQRMVAFMRRSHVLFVTDAYGRRLDAFSAKARQIVADGTAAGLGRQELAVKLSKAAEGIAAARTGPYWEIVAGAFVGRGRSYAQVSAYADAGVRLYRIEAVMDERTSTVCRLLHGREFAVDDALDLFTRAERAGTIQAITALSPWLREKDGRLTRSRGGAAISSGTASFPPYHPLCRTATVAV